MRQNNVQHGERLRVEATEVASWRAGDAPKTKSADHSVVASTRGFLRGFYIYITSCLQIILVRDSITLP